MRTCSRNLMQDRQYMSELEHTKKDTSTDDHTLSLVNQMLKDDLIIGIGDLS